MRKQISWTFLFLVFAIFLVSGQAGCPEKQVAEEVEEQKVAEEVVVKDSAKVDAEEITAEKTEAKTEPSTQVITLVDGSEGTYNILGEDRTVGVRVFFAEVRLEIDGESLTLSEGDEDTTADGLTVTLNEILLGRSEVASTRVELEFSK